MASRKEQKERLRAERIAQEQAERQETSRRRRLQICAAAAAVLIIGAGVAVIGISRGGGGGDSHRGRRRGRQLERRGAHLPPGFRAGRGGAVTARHAAAVEAELQAVARAGPSAGGAGV